MPTVAHDGVSACVRACVLEGHIFHGACLVGWVRREQSCPVCFTKIGVKSTPASPSGGAAPAAAANPVAAAAFARATAAVFAEEAAAAGGEGEGRGGGGGEGAAAAAVAENIAGNTGNAANGNGADADADADADVVLPWWLQWADRLVRGRHRQAQLPPEELQRMTAHLAQIFPHVDVALISADLQLTGNAEMTSENIMDGRL